jgi:elongation factor G
VDRAKIVAKAPRSDENIDVELENSNPVVQVFKTISEAHVGDLSFFRVYSGKVTTGMDMFNTSRGTTERFGQLFVLNGKNRISVNSLIQVISVPC